MGAMVAEGKVLAVEVDEEEGEHEEDEKRAAGEADDQAEVWAIGGMLFDIHGFLDAKQCDHVGGRESNVAVRALSPAAVGG